MKNSFFNLVPERILYDQFWIEVRNRNRWLILVRYGAVIMFSLIIFGIYLMENVIPGFVFNTLTLWIIAGSILVYNISYDSLWNSMPNMKYGERKFHSLHFSLFQVLTDYIALILTVYFTGGIESPLYALFILYVIIVSFFLPGRIIIVLVTVVYLITMAGAFLEKGGYIPHHGLEGILKVSLFNNNSYFTIFFVFFGLVLYLAVYISNTIARELYARERNLTKSFKELEDSEKTKFVFINALLKKLRLPVTQAVDALKKQGSPESALIKLEESVYNFEQLEKLNLQNLKPNLEGRDYINISKLFEEIYQEISIPLNSKKINYTFRMQSRSGSIMKSDKRLLKIAFSRLLYHSLESTGTNGNITVRLFDDGNFFNISIRDDAAALGKEHFELLFDNFIKNQESISENGFGLPVVKEILILLGGTIEFEIPDNDKDSNVIFRNNYKITLPK